jgi:hypothetical protein
MNRARRWPFKRARRVALLGGKLHIGRSYISGAAQAAVGGIELGFLTPDEAE